MIPIQSIEDYLPSFKKGEEKGFDYFFHLYYKPLVHFAFTIVPNIETAEDVVEDSFIQLWEKRQLISQASGIKPYLYASVRNRCIDFLRKQSHSNLYLNHLKKLPPEFAADHSQKIIISEAMHQVFLAVQNLPPKYQKVFKMIYVEEKEIKEIAVELNLPVSTIRSQKTKVLELLKNQLPHLGLFIFFLIVLNH